MRYLVSTKETQGQRKNDFCFVPEGEPLRFGMECDGEEIDGHCGCMRSMVGGSLAQSTTTMKVVDLDKTEVELMNEQASGLNKWMADIPEEHRLKEIRCIGKIANHFQPGDVLERRGNGFIRRA